MQPVRMGQGSTAWTWVTPAMPLRASTSLSCLQVLVQGLLVRGEDPKVPDPRNPVTWIPIEHSFYLACSLHQQGAPLCAKHILSFWWQGSLKTVTHRCVRQSLPASPLPKHAGRTQGHRGSLRDHEPTCFLPAVSF